MTESSKTQPTYEGSGFVAGTLVHAKDGLIPIEKIQVGDWVLSKSETGKGEQSYQRVTRVFVHENQKVLCVDMYTEKELLAARAERRTMNRDTYFLLVVTDNYLFRWVDKGWFKARQLHLRMFSKPLLIELVDGSTVYVEDINLIVRTQQPNLGWLMGGKFCPVRFDENDSRWVDFSKEMPVTSYEYLKKIPNDGIEWWLQRDSDRFRRTVFDITVENTHTYYVGEQGVWVHEPRK
ncbi:hypothetical protein [Methylomagnum sp.]